MRKFIITEKQLNDILFGQTLALYFVEDTADSSNNDEDRDTYDRTMNTINQVMTQEITND
jgi:hypothetical protein